MGHIQDTPNSSGDVNGGAIAIHCDLSRRTMLYGMADTLRNNGKAGFRPAGSSALPFNFSTPNDIDGRTTNGLQLGTMHRF